MIQNPPPGPNQNMPEHGAAYISFGNFAASVKDHKTLAVILIVGLILLGLFILSPTKINDFLDRHFINPKAWKQYDLYAEKQKAVQSVIENWNRIESIDDISKTEVKSIRASIKGALQRFKNLDISELPRINEVIWHHDLARLYNIQYDITQDEKYFNKAIEHLDIADDIASGDTPPKLTKAEIIFFEKYKISHEIQWTYLASYSINVALGKQQYLAKLDELKTYFGGCKALLDESLDHKRMLKGIGCEE
ncbi:hypothetical protein L1077_16590 [Pseudoalteromonas luteoviolacea]|uniref:hypothetical protein n=1 Tax=Pseudoalteromonas luteoviolacea TaxID=43657 RepID=UPI001F3AC263|nr:hypothetical protein [Pseudoalteromonas luteoviolacea]MCF6441056.1 hypothetical protein [Pseudoalteromonas luteoviolacea]